VSCKVILICYSIHYVLWHCSLNIIVLRWKIRRNTIICLFFAVPLDQELTAAQIVILRQTMNKIRETVHRIASEHRDLHSTVSKVGKAIDRASIFIFMLMLSVRLQALYLVLRLLSCSVGGCICYVIHMKRFCQLLCTYDSCR
jgi:hypothetical protein